LTYFTPVKDQEFAHFMLKEIHEQPVVAQACFNEVDISPEINSLIASLNKPLINFGLQEELFNQIDHIQFIACGTSLHACLIGKYWLEQFAGILTTVHAASELRHGLPPARPNTLTIAISQSGETADVLIAVELLRSQREQLVSSLPIQFLGITNRSGSSLEQQVQHCIHTPAGPEIGVAATKTFTATLLTLFSFAVDLAAHRHALSLEKLEHLRLSAQQLPTQIGQVLETLDSAIATLAHDWLDIQSCILLGRGINMPIALEGALKLKETAYIHAEGFAAGEFMHGPLALLDAEIPVVAIAMPGSAYEAVLTNLSNVKARGAPLIGITSTSQSATLQEMCDRVLLVPDIDETLSPLLTVLPLQLLAYHAAVKRGLDVDRPRGLTKYLSTL
jgi:glucosamine--fructose-6-phosphate aminotransferase (isomerizing)